MIPPSFDYHVPDSVNDAIGMLQKYGSEAKILSGGMSLIPLMKLRLAEPAHLIDINRISGLDYIKESDGFLKIGALAREGTEGQGLMAVQTRLMSRGERARLACLVCALAAGYSAYALLKHWHFDSSYDLAIFDQAGLKESERYRSRAFLPTCSLPP